MKTIFSRRAAEFAERRKYRIQDSNFGFLPASSLYLDPVMPPSVISAPRAKAGERKVFASPAEAAGGILRS
jgi:hypothetical protein